MPTLISDDGRVYSVPESVMQDLFLYRVDISSPIEGDGADVVGQAADDEKTLDELCEAHIHRVLVMSEYRLDVAATTLGMDAPDLEKILASQAAK